MIPYGRQDIIDCDIDEVVKVLRSDFLTQGPAVPEFERVICEYVGAKHGVAVSNATAALHIACLALGLKQGDVLWTTPISFVASANCAKYCGADVDFVDIDPFTFNISPQNLADKLITAEKKGALPKILVVVHMCGLPSEMQAISLLATRYGFKIIEDASHAVGSEYQGRKVGDCKYSEVTVFSFHPVKIITTAEGGMLLTNNSEIATRLRLLRSHGITRERGKMTKVPDGPWFYEQIELGFNYRMTDMQAALGISQLKRLDQFISARNQLAGFYKEILKDLPVTWQQIPSDCYSSYHLFVVRMDLKNKSQKEVHEGLVLKGIAANLHYIPIYRHPFYSKFGYDPQNFPASENYYKEALTLPLYPKLGTENVKKICAELFSLLC